MHYIFITAKKDFLEVDTSKCHLLLDGRVTSGIFSFPFVDFKTYLQQVGTAVIVSI